MKGDPMTIPHSMCAAKSANGDIVSASVAQSGVTHHCIYCDAPMHLCRRNRRSFFRLYPGASHASNVRCLNLQHQNAAISYDSIDLQRIFKKVLDKETPSDKPMSSRVSSSSSGRMPAAPDLDELRIRSMRLIVDSDLITSSRIINGSGVIDLSDHIVAPHLLNALLDEPTNLIDHFVLGVPDRCFHERMEIRFSLKTHHSDRTLHKIAFFSVRMEERRTFEVMERKLFHPGTPKPVPRAELNTLIAANWTKMSKPSCNQFCSSKLCHQCLGYYVTRGVRSSQLFTFPRIFDLDPGYRE